MQETQILSLGREDPLEEEMATHSCLGILAWEIPGTKEPGWLQFMELQKFLHNLVTKQQGTPEPGLALFLGICDR